MDHLSVTDVTRIANEAVREHSPALEVIAVMLGGEGDYAEVIIDIGGCRKEPCRFSVGIFRNTTARVVHDEIAGQIRQHVREHAH
jgi:hypothetical protein